MSNYKGKKFRAMQHNKNYERLKGETGSKNLLDMVSDAHEKANRNITVDVSDLSIDEGDLIVAYINKGAGDV